MCQFVVCRVSFISQIFGVSVTYSFLVLTHFSFLTLSSFYYMELLLLSSDFAIFFLTEGDHDGVISWLF